MLRLISFILVSVLLLSCGQKGPLYLPDQETKAHAETTNH